ncbi:MAG: alkaline phosphatase family protein [Crenarchaeota archaeon]|nr:alkaline phosphatase family protein [Thermoproteota archaeon]MCR8455171.1 alkaline phosphatase family protein [Thermoproteota archaeon]MCR8473354.1 alkaline phosphatase family protein [Thermoproteota archaeon]MCR8488920.1 alkaline phosphatase family protein [Thermoproteota archaeon]MCR8501233.1 alkaline phosphatase family protein [Thermoproteota archaeon]
MIILTKLFILGIDSADPAQVFSLWLDELPNLKEVANSGSYGIVASTVPPITCPAWVSAFTGHNPGSFGLYDLRYIKRHYFEYALVNSRIIKPKRVWNYLGEHDKRSITVMVPVTYPPQKIKGIQLADFLTPDVNSQFVWPYKVKDEILKIAGGAENYIIDIENYRRINPKELYRLLINKVDHDFKIIKYLAQRYKWDLFIAVIMSIDRAQHTLWKFFDRGHPRFVEDPELEFGLLNIYKRIDEHLGELIDMLPDDTNYIICSDHGAKRMIARINANEILIEEGFLKLDRRPKHPLAIDEAFKEGYIDIKSTVAFAVGAFVAQVFINTKDKPMGVVSDEDYLATRQQVAEALKEVRGQYGERLDNVIYFKEDVYKGEKLHLMPDITIYFDNLHYGSNELIGSGSPYSLETTRGADDSNHGEFGILIMSGPNIPKKDISKAKLEDLTPTILDLFDIHVDVEFDGRTILG